MAINEGLEALGTDEYQPDGKTYFGVFEGSGLRRVRLPPTLKRIEYRTFLECKGLKKICFPEGLEYIGPTSFSRTGLERVELPVSLRTIKDHAFSQCERL